MLGEFDIICPMSETWPWWTVTVYHDAALMLRRRRYSGDADEHGLRWNYEENDEPIEDDDPTYWWRAWKTYGNVELHWLADTPTAASQLLELDAALARLHRS